MRIFFVMFLGKMVLDFKHKVAQVMVDVVAVIGQDFAHSFENWCGDHLAVG